jgi:TonB-dependent SusC/RagA subfamily outer membrane receptor
MKATYFFIAVLLVSVVFLGCSGSKNTSSQQYKNDNNVVDAGYDQKLSKDANQSNVMVKPNEDKKSNISLDDMIRRLPGVQVSGSGRNARIKVSGSESFMAGTDPLFILNGSAMPNYAQVFSVVNPNDIDTITVLKGSDATIYGSRGANGVIVIRTKKNP